MENKIVIQNFGPIKEAQINLNKNFQIFIGTQASGKSTICKVVYFVQKIRDYTLDYLMDATQFTQNHKNEYFTNYMKYLTKQFMGCFGKTKHMQKFNISYMFAGKQINIFLNRDGYVRFSLDAKLKEELLGLINEASEMFLNNFNTKGLLDNITAVGVMKRLLNERLILVFGTKIPEMITDYVKTVKGQINNAAVDQAYEFIKKILKADYISENDGEKIYFDEHHWVKLMYGSSGQQEVLWILMLAFATILEKKKSFIIIEEPEAHLFPIAQKDVISLISLMINSTNSKIIITTHSPYILTSTNILLFSEKVENQHTKLNKIIIPKNLRVSYENFAAYKVDNSEKVLESLLDEESHMIDTNYIDEVSSITNSELDELITMEIDE